MHPLAKEKITIEKLADRFRNMKTHLIFCAWQEGTDRMQNLMDKLSRAIWHRRVAYNLVRQEIDFAGLISGAIVGVTDTEYTSEPLNMASVNHRRIRLSSAIMKYQRDEIERLLCKLRNHRNATECDGPCYEVPKPKCDMTSDLAEPRYVAIGMDSEGDEPPKNMPDSGKPNWGTLDYPYLGEYMHVAFGMDSEGDDPPKNMPDN